MIFSSIPFLYYFLPCVLLLYFAAPGKWKNAVLFFTSIVFYAWGEPKFVLVMLLTILQGYLFGILIEKNGGCRARVYLTVSVYWATVNMRTFLFRILMRSRVCPFRF